jgi:hypothetical protein
MRYLTEVVCSNCGHREDTTEYNKECPICVDDVLKEVWLECECGKAYNEGDIENAQNNFISWKELIKLSPEELWEEAWYVFAYSDWTLGRGFTYGNYDEPPDANGLTYTGSSDIRWCYGSETYTWWDYYKCECGKELELDNGW